MALAPHVQDKKRKEVLKHVEDLKKEGTEQAKDKLKEEFNIDADGKKKIVGQDGKPAKA